MKNYINKKNYAKSILILLSFLAFFAQIEAKQDTFFKIQHIKMNAFINKVRTLQQIDSVKTQIINNQSLQINQYQSIIKMMQKKSTIDSLIIKQNNERIKQLSKKQPFFLTKEAFYTYGIATVLIILILVK